MKKLIIILLFLISNFLFAAKINGFITDESNGERVPYATVIVKGTNKGAQANEQGYFVINKLYSGKVTLSVQQIGYKTKLVEVVLDNINSREFVKVAIKSQSIELMGTEVKGNLPQLDLSSRFVDIGKIKQTTIEMKEVAYIAEADVFRAIQTLPGVTSISDFSSGLYIRGGSADQNLLLLDEVDVYNPNHFGGLFSTFNPDAIQSVELFKGGFPAKYGGRLSAVLDLQNLDGNRVEMESVSHISLISASSTVQSPWKLGTQGGSLMGSFRRTYFDLITKNYDLPEYYFYDGHFKFNWDLPNNDKLITSFYFGKDKLELSMGFDLGIKWGNETFSQRWVHIITPSLFSHFIVAGSHYGSELTFNFDSETPYSRFNDIYDVTLKSIFNYQPNEEHLVDFGYDLKYNKIKFDVEMGGTNLSEDQFMQVDVDGFTNNLFVQDSWNIWEVFTLQPGLRLTHYFSTTDKLPMAKDANFFRVSPRFSARYMLTEHSNISFNYGRYYQYLTSVNQGTSTPFDIWFPLDGDMKPGESDHFILGYEVQLNNFYSLEIEGYYKNYKNLVESRPEADSEWDNNTSTISDIYNTGKGYSFGSDILLKNRFYGLDGFVGYSFGITRRKISNVNCNPQTNEEEYFYPRYDRTHQINIVESFNLTQNLGFEIWGGETRISSTFNYSTGQPYSKPESIYFDGETPQILYSYNDRVRLDDYLRLDLSLKTKWYYTHWNFEPYIQAINVTKHDNIWSKDFEVEINEAGQFEIVEYETNQFPFFIFVGFNFEW